MRTLPYVNSERVVGVALSERIELVKWLGVLLMLWDHTRYLGGLPGWQVMGRGAYPLFAIAFGYALTVAPDARQVLRRLLMFGLLAEALGAWAVSESAQLNVLFSFALATWLVHLDRRDASMTRRVTCWLIALLLAELTEYGIAGLLFTMACYYGWRRARVWALPVVAASVLLVVPNDSFLATWWTVAACGLLMLPVGVPRIKRAFYAVYVGQWPIWWVLR